LREEKLENLGSLRERQLLVKLCDDFKIERGGGFSSGYLHHLIDGFWGNEE
jgi:hypothetical protein